MSIASTIYLWSAAPTPLTETLEVDEASVERMVERSVAAGISGLFLAGTCGEGPWLSDRERSRLLAAAARAAAGRLELAMQVTDTSVPRIRDNILRARDAGAGIAVIGPPPLMLNVTPARIVEHFEGAATASPLPVGIYDLGQHRPFSIPVEQLQRVLLHPNVVLLKDSSGNAERQRVALAARRAKPGLRLFSGDEFNGVAYLEAGYDGMMFGGGAAIGEFMRAIAAHLQQGQATHAAAVERRMVALLHGIYGGPKLTCWLTGLKYFLVRQGVFSGSQSFLQYPLTDECRAFIERAAAAPVAAS